MRRQKGIGIEVNIGWVHVAEQFARVAFSAGRQVILLFAEQGGCECEGESAFPDAGRADEEEGTGESATLEGLPKAV